MHFLDLDVESCFWTNTFFYLLNCILKSTCDKRIGLREEIVGIVIYKSLMVLTWLLDDPNQ